MAITASEQTLSPYQFFVGQKIFMEDCRAVARALNYAYSRRQEPLAVVNAYRRDSTDFIPHLVNKTYTSSPITVYVYQTFIYVPATFGSSSLVVGATGTTPASNALTVEFEFTGLTSGTATTTVTIDGDASPAESNVEQTGDRDVSSINSGNGGWMLLRVGWYRSTGTSNSVRFTGWRVQLPQVAGSSLP